MNEMSEFNKQDKAMMDKIKENPSKYKIYVDNDCMSVAMPDDEDFDYEFSESSYYFALQLLKYIGIDAEMVQEADHECVRKDEILCKVCELGNEHVKMCSGFHEKQAIQMEQTRIDEIKGSGADRGIRYSVCFEP